MNPPWSNWAGTATAVPKRVVRPATTDELAAAVRLSVGDGLKVKAIGAGHSFTPAAVAEGTRVDLGRMTSLIHVDTAAKRVTVQAGMTIAALNAILAQHGLAMPNLGDIDVQTISGALATGTHGTGAAYGCLSTFIAGLELVTATGEVIHCDAGTNPDVFNAARVNVGALGVVSAVTLQCCAAFVLQADERPAPLNDVWAGLDEHIAANDHFEFYWFPYTDRVQLKRNNRVEHADRPLPAWRHWLDDQFLSNTAFAGVCRLGRAIPATVPTISRVSARALSARTYTAPSHEVFCSPRRVRFTEMEYGIPREHLREAFDALRKIVDELPFRVIFPVEIRFTAADDIWLSHGYGRDSAYIAIHQYAGAPFAEYFVRFEEVCRDLGGRPHWGKMHHRDAAALASVYPRFEDFRAVRDKLDPARVFANAYTDQVFGA